MYLWSTILLLQVYLMTILRNKDICPSLFIISFITHATSNLNAYQCLNQWHLTRVLIQWNWFLAHVTAQWECPSQEQGKGSRWYAPCSPSRLMGPLPSPTPGFYGHYHPAGTWEMRGGSHVDISMGCIREWHTWLQPSFHWLELTQLATLNSWGILERQSGCESSKERQWVWWWRPTPKMCLMV